MNEPPDHTAVLSAANLLSPTGMTVPKYSLNSSGVLAQRGVGVEEEDALLLEVLADLVVDDLGLVLRGDAGDQPLLLRLGDAELVVGVLDVLGQVLPGRGLLLGRPDEVLDVVEVDGRSGRRPRSASACGRTAAGPSAAGRASTAARLFFAEMSAHDGLVEAALRGGAGDVGVGPAVLVACRGRRARGGTVVVMRWSSPRWGWCGRCRSCWSAGRPVVLVGTLVVQTPSPWAMVASRWTWLPEQPGEDLGLGLAQLRELRGDVRDRAVVLADLVAVRCRADRGSVAVGGQRPGQRLGRSSCGTASSSGAYRASSSAERRRANSSTASSPPVSARKRSALTARSS